MKAAKHDKHCRE